MEVKKSTRKKLTFEDIYDDFCKKWPKETKKVQRWEAYNVELIRIYMRNGSVVTYSYPDKLVKIIKEKDERYRRD